MKYIRKRKDNRWQYSRVVNGVRKYIYAKTLKELLEKKKAEKPQKKEKPKIISLYEWSVQYYKNFRENKKLSLKTKEEYQNLLNRHLRPVFEEKEITKITVLDLQNFLNTRPVRIAEKLFQFLSAAYKKAYALGIVKSNIAEFLEKPKKEKKKKMPLTLEEQKAFLKILESVDPLVKKYCMFCLVLGARRNEALAFMPEDINLKNSTIRINGTKTSNAERTIRITKAMANYLLEGTEPKKKVFNWNCKSAYDKVVEALEAAGIKGKSTHNLRYTCATNLYYLGMPDKHRQHQLGHASIVTTNDIYTQIELDVKADDIRELYPNLYYEFWPQIWPQKMCKIKF